MKFEIKDIEKVGGKVAFIVVEWFPDMIDKTIFRRRKHIATYVKTVSGWQIYNTNKIVKSWTPPKHWFDEIERNLAEGERNPDQGM